MQILLLLLLIWSIHGLDRLRLQGGEGPCTGRVEVFHDNAWGIVCNHKWQKANDEVICRSLGCGVPEDHSMAYTIPNIPKQAWMNEVNCTGSPTKSNLWDCPFAGWGVNKCPPEHHINIECSEKISLTLEYGCAGAVQYTTSKGKGAVCHANWGKKEADIVCRERNCGVSTSVPLAGTYRAERPARISSLNCAGDETFLWQCSPRFGSGEECADPVGVICSDYRALRLIGGSHSCSGKLEVKVSDTWKSICKTDYRLLSAAELCSQLRCGNSGHLEPGTCNGTEQVNLTCSDTVKIVLLDSRGKESKCFGNVHVEDKSGKRGAVCDDERTKKQAGVVCRELGCGAALDLAPLRGRASGWLSRVQCLGTEASLWHCPARYDRVSPSSCQGAYVVCEGSVDMRLADGLGRCSGRVEVLYEGTWKSAQVSGRTDDFIATALHYVCEKQNCGKMNWYGSDRFSPGNAETWDLKASCTDHVSSFKKCFTFQPDRFQQKKESTKVICTEEKMLYLLGDTPCSGKVGIKIASKNYWLPGSLETWKNDTAAAVCRQAKCESVVSFKTVPRDDSQEAWNSTYKCSSNETSLFDCTPEAKENNSEIAFVHCSGSKSLSLEKQCWGTLHVCVGKSCGGVCADMWTQELSDIVCQQLGCGNALHKDLVDGRKAPGTLFQSVHCAVPVQNLTNLTQCSFIPTSDKNYCQQNPVYITCSGSVQARLVHPRDRCSGNVEMFVSGSWYPVCNEALGKDVQEAFCKDADCSWNSTSSDSLYGTPRASGISAIKCTETKTLKECLNTAVRKDCFPGRLQCSGRVSMLLGDGACKGRVFALVEGSDEYPVAMENWGVPESKMLCKYLRCGEYVRHEGRPSLLKNWYTAKSRCFGNETNIWDCVTVARAKGTPAKSEQLHVECSDTPILRLSGNRCSGQVEIKIGQKIGGVCGQPWEEKESRVVCQELNCSHAIDFKTGQPQGNQGEANSVSCNGKESKLWQCGTKRDACKSGLVSVTCADDVQFNLTEKCGGEVQVYYWGEWQSVCPLPSPTSTEARMICAHLGCGDPFPRNELMQETERKDMRPSISCTGSEKFIRHCVRKPKPCTTQKTAFVYCKDYVPVPDLPPEAPAVDTGNPIMVPLLLFIVGLVLVAAVIICLWIRRGAMSTEIRELTTRVLPEVPEGAVEVDVEGSHETSSYSEYDDIEEEAADAARLLEEESATHEPRETLENVARVPESAVEVDVEGSHETSTSSEYDDIEEEAADAARLLEEGSATHEPRETLENVASATGGEAESQQDYDDVIEPPLVREPQSHRNYEDSSERILGGN